MHQTLLIPILYRTAMAMNLVLQILVPDIARTQACGLDRNQFARLSRVESCLY